MPKITFVGAGSTVFARNLLGDILNFPELAESEICLFDIDAQRLQESEVAAQKIVKFLNANPTLETTTDRRAALDGADYAIGMFQIGGYKPGTIIDFEIPRKYGLRQTIADTLGIGGIMRSLRTIPVIQKLCDEWENNLNPSGFVHGSTPSRFAPANHFRMRYRRQLAKSGLLPCLSASRVLASGSNSKSRQH